MQNFFIIFQDSSNYSKSNKHNSSSKSKENNSSKNAIGHSMDNTSGVKNEVELLRARVKILADEQGR